MINVMLLFASNYIENSTVCHYLDKSIVFKAGAFAIKELSDGGLFTNCYKPQEHNNPLNNHCVLQYTKEPKPNSYETVLVEETKQCDMRIKVKNTTEWPFCVHGRMDMQFESELYSGSGVMVGPHHFLTCGHNVYHGIYKTWAQNITIYLGQENQTVHFGAVKGVRVYTCKEWVDNQDNDYDIALVVLEHSLGKITGYAGMGCLTDSKLSAVEVQVTGYPVDKGLLYMYTMSRKLQKISKHRLSYLIDTFAGKVVERFGKISCVFHVF